MTKTPCLSLLTLLMLLFGVQSQAAIITYNSLAAFNLDAPGLALENFEAGVVGPGSAVPLFEPIDSATSNGAFPAGIQAGLTVGASLDLPPGHELWLEGDGTVGNVSKVIYTANPVPGQTLNLFFDNANAVGFDVLISSIDGDIEISLFGASDAFLGSYSVATNRQGVFFGAINDAGTISRVNLAAGANAGPYEGVDNIRFGRVPAPAPFLLVALGLFAARCSRARQQRG